MTFTGEVEAELRYLKLKNEREPSDFLRGRIEIYAAAVEACRAVDRSKVRKGDFLCRDCKASEYPGYMVENSVWLQAWPSYPAEKDALEGQFDDGDAILTLCIPCLEKRLGRSLTVQDVRPIPFNRWLLDKIQSRVEPQP